MTRSSLITRLVASALCAVLFASCLFLANSGTVYAAGPYNINYGVTPPAGYNTVINNLFTYVGHTGNDANYQNVAVVADDTNSMYGSMWAKQKLDLTQPFTTTMYLFMFHKSGNNTATDLADGMTFVLQNDPRGTSAIGSDGEGLGVYGSRYYSSANPVAVISNSVAIEFDLYPNGYASLPNDHFVNDPVVGDTNGNCALVFPKAPLGYTRIETTDHQNSFSFPKQRAWLPFSVTWTPSGSGGTLTYVFNGTSKSVNIPSVSSTFGGSSVYWGFTGATGGQSSVLAAAITGLPAIYPSKEVASTSAAGQNGATVKVGDLITYQINYANDSPTSATVAISDTLDSGLDYVSSSNSGTYNSATRTVNWTINAVPPATTGRVTLTARVNESASVKVANKATTTLGNDTPRVTNTVENPVQPLYKLIYDVNGGNNNGPATETGLSPQNNRPLNSTVKPTHPDVAGRPVSFLGWTATRDTKIYELNDPAKPAVISTVNIVDHDVTVYALWGYATPPDHILHVRQVLLPAVGETTLPTGLSTPTMGYMTLTAYLSPDLSTPVSTMNITTNSQIGDIPQYFTDYKLAVDATKNVYGVNDIVPQYFKYAGYVLTTSITTPHSATAMNTDPDILVDYSAMQTEYWLTIYLRPDTDTPIENLVIQATNQFGTITEP